MSYKAVNHSFFSKWNEEMAWVLGFWAADGHARFVGNTECISFSQKNRKIIEQIRKCVKSRHKVYKGKGNVYSLTYSSKQQYSDLCEIFMMDNLGRKSLSLSYPQIPRQYVSAFVRGYVDGDGCLRFHNAPRIEIVCGSLMFLSGLVESILDNSGIKGEAKRRADNTIFIASYVGIRAVCLAWWLYNGCSISLERKRKKAREFIVWQGNRIMKKSLTVKMCEMFPQFIPEKYSLSTSRQGKGE